LIPRQRIALGYCLLALAGIAPAGAQTSPPAPSSEAPEFPQWAEDLRRWEIIAFGSFPFTMFAATFAIDTRRWIDANGMDWSDSGRRYAPWPLKSAGAVGMENGEQELTIGIAVGMSLAVAMADMIIVQIKRNKARHRAEALPEGTPIITRKRWPTAGSGEGAAGEGHTEDDGGGETGEGISEGGAAPDAP
jgi:hypothetical protein